MEGRGRWELKDVEEGGGGSVALPGAWSWNNLSTCGQKWDRMPREVVELEQAAQGSAGVTLEGSETTWMWHLV